MFLRYVLAITICITSLHIQAMLPSAARRSGAALLSLGRTAQKNVTSANLKSLGESITKRAHFIKTQQKNLLPKRPFSSSGFSFLSKKEPSFTSNQSWWQAPAKITATLAGGLGLTKLSTYLYRQWDLSNLQTFINNLHTDLQSASLEQISKNIQTLQYYVKVDDPNITPKAKELLNELRNLYITKKYHEMPQEDFAAMINKNPRYMLLSIKDDILLVHENNDIILPQSITNKLTALKNTPVAKLLLDALEKNIWQDTDTLNNAAGKYFVDQAKQSLGILEAIKEILKPDQTTPEPDQPERYASYWDPNDPLPPF